MSHDDHIHVHGQPAHAPEAEDPFPSKLVGACYGSTNPAVTDLMVLMLGQLPGGWVVITHLVSANEESAKSDMDEKLAEFRRIVPAANEVEYEWVGKKTLEEVLSAYPPAVRGQAALN